MPRRLQAFLLASVWGVALPVAAQEADPPPVEQRPAPDGTGKEVPEEVPAGTAAEPTVQSPAPSRAEVTANTQVTKAADAAVKPPPPTAAPVEQNAGWDTFVRGYFRAPMAIGLSPRKGPDDPNGPARLQLTYGPNRTVDANYYSFAYTRLQEQDWAELFIHAKKKHVEAVVGLMGYWFQAAGFRNNDAAWAPGLAYLKLDTDFAVGGIKPNIAFTGGAFWPAFGYFEKYDTYTLGRFRHVGEQLHLTLPLSADLTVAVVQGFGTARDGLFNLFAPPPYQSQVGLALLHYEHVRLKYKDYVDVGLHYNGQWTRDPSIWVSTTPGKSYADARAAEFTTLGGEVSVRVPRAGRLWVSPSYTRLRNGWALGEAGIEMMHSLSGDGFAANYLAWNASPNNSSGSGSTLNLGFLYENTLSGILGQPPDKMPELAFSAFGLLANANLDLPPGTALTQDHIGQFKYGADLSLQATKWLGLMLRWDEVNYDLDHPGYIFSAITPRVTFSTHFLSGESIYIQYSRYRYGDRMVLAGKWPWGQQLVAGSDFIQGGHYSGQRPDADVIRLQASAAF
jgi:hypothetical protein